MIYENKGVKYGYASFLIPSFHPPPTPTTATKSLRHFVDDSAKSSQQQRAFNPPRDEDATSATISLPHDPPPSLRLCHPITLWRIKWTQPTKVITDYNRKLWSPPPPNPRPCVDCVRRKMAAPLYFGERADIVKILTIHAKGRGKAGICGGKNGEGICGEELKYGIFNNSGDQLLDSFCREFYF